ncbi:MAG: hypothetical protein WD598_12915 [Acidimicrobiia bacterium]
MLDPSDSWWLKLARAQKHLDDFNGVAAKYASTCEHPVRKRLEGEGKRQRTVHRIDIAQPAPGLFLPVVLGDFLFNLRSALDHIMVRSVPRRRRFSTQFPIFTQDIWERNAKGDYLKRHDDARRNWYTWTHGLSDDALTIVKAAQPFNATNPDPAEIGVKNHMLAILSALQNADKHRELVVVGGYVSMEHVLARLQDGSTHAIQSSVPPPPGQSRHILEHRAEIDVATVLDADPATVNVEVKGSVEVLVGRGGDDAPKWNLSTLTDMHGFVNNRLLDLARLL